ncbi:prenylcysteine oxidase 1-like [Glandiceps talaboti]
MATALRRVILVAPVCFIFSRFICHAREAEQQADPPVRIGILGGGIGGSSCSYFLRNLFGERAELDVYDPGDIGGRLSTVNIGGHIYESGATVIHPKNMYMQEFVQTLGLKHKDKPTSSKMGIYNGEEFVFIESDWSMVTFAKLFWKYGFNLIKLNSALKTLIDKYSRIYDIQANHGIAYSSVEGILKAMGGEEYVDYTKVHLAQLLKDEGYGDEFINEMVSIATRVNYGQSANMSAFAGMVSLAGVQGGLWSVYGSNKQVCSRLLEESKATVYKTAVSGVKLSKKGGYYLVIADQPDRDGKPRTHIAGKYDIIVVAVPLHDGMSNINFTGFPKEIKNFPQPYHRTVATFVDGQLDAKAFGCSDMKTCPNAILTTRDNKFGINSVAHNFAVDYQKEKVDTQKPVWKVFSKKPLSGEQFDKIFKSREETKVVDWLAYPHYNPPDILPEFELYDRLYYINGVEWAASAMDMVAVGSKNTALLAYNKYYELNDKIDQQIKQKNEL